MSYYYYNIIVDHSVVLKLLFWIDLFELSSLFQTIKSDCESFIRIFMVNQALMIMNHSFVALECIFILCNTHLLRHFE